MVPSETYQEDKGLEQGPSDLVSHTLLSLLAGGSDVSISWLRKSAKDSCQGGLGLLSLSSSLDQVTGLCRC
jgi:hypothetical protein